VGLGWVGFRKPLLGEVWIDRWKGLVVVGCGFKLERP
jgi:hypothetical protein